MISISVRSKKYDCDITLRQKVTVVRGHSGREYSQRLLLMIVVRILLILVIKVMSL